MTENQPVNGVHRAIVAITAALAREGISKDRKNQQQGFNFRGVEDVYAALAPKLAEHGLVIVPQCEEVTDSVRTTKSGGSLYCCRVRVRYILAAADTSEYHAIVYGEGADQGDKATSKALSMAFKYFAFQTFCIPVDGQDDADAETPEPTVAAKPAPKSKPAAKDGAVPFDSPEQAAAAIKAAESAAGLLGVGMRIKASPFVDEEIKSLGALYTARHAALKQVAAT